MLKLKLARRVIHVGSSPFLQILNTCDPSLGICDHLREEVGEARPTGFGIAATIEMSVVDGLAVGRDSESRGWLRCWSLLWGLWLLLVTGTRLRCACIADGHHGRVSWGCGHDVRW